MPISKLFTKGANRQAHAQPIEEEMIILRNILNKRIPSHLIEPEIMDKIIIYSGGVLREAIRITRQCCFECSLFLTEHTTQQDVKINQHFFDLAIRKIRNDFATPLANSHYQILKQVYNNYNFDSKDDNEQQKFLNLLHGEYILEYRNDDVWYDVHPVVADLLRRRGLLL